MSTIFILIIFLLAVGGAFLLFSKPSEDSSSKSSSEENFELGTSREEKEIRPSGKGSNKTVSTKEQTQNFLKKNLSSTNPSITPHQLPPTPSHIYGRKTALTEFVAILKKKIPILGVHGRSGMGKTKLIFILANRLLPNFRDAQFYIDMKADQKDPLTIRDVMIRVVRSFQPTINIPSDSKSLSKIYQTALKGMEAVLILDNANIKEPLSCLSANGIRLMILITEKPCSMEGMQSFNLETLTPEDGLDFLNYLSTRVGFGASEIIRGCANFPLSILLAGHFLATSKNTDSSTYLDNLREERKKNKLGDKRGLDSSIKSTFNLSYRDLEPKTACALRKLTYFPGPFSSMAAEFIVEDENNNRMSEMMMYGLVHFDAFNNRYFIHPQIKKLLEVRMGKSERESTARRHCSYYMTLVATVNEYYEKGGDDIERAMNLFDLEIDNIRIGQAWAQNNGPRDNEADKWCNAYTELASPFMAKRFTVEECVDWLETGLSSARRLQDVDTEKAHLLNLGSLYNKINRPETALEYLNQSLTIAVEQKDELGERRVLGQLGATSMAMGKPHQAIEFYEKELELIQSSDNPSGEQITMEHLGRIYLNVREYQKALEYAKNGLSLARELNDSDTVGQLLDNIGKIHIARHEYEAAIEYLSEGLTLARENGNAPIQINLLQSLGDAQAELGEPSSAMPMYEEALVLSQETGERFREGCLMISLGDIHSKTRKNEQAANYYQKALALFEVTEKRVDEAKTLLKIAHEMDKSGDILQAVQFGQRAKGLHDDLFLPDRNKVSAQVSVWEAALPQQESESSAQLAEPAEQADH